MFSSWHYTKCGNYFVKSGYHVAGNSWEECSRGPIGHSAMLFLKFWHSNSQSKMKIFIVEGHSWYYPNKISFSLKKSNDQHYLSPMSIIPRTKISSTVALLLGKTCLVWKFNLANTLCLRGNLLWSCGTRLSCLGRWILVLLLWFLGIFGWITTSLCLRGECLSPSSVVARAGSLWKQYTSCQSLLPNPSPSPSHQFSGAYLLSEPSK